MGFLFTSESVSEGHPDKVSDQISDAILDEFLRHDEQAKVACETLCTTGLVVVSGEVRSEAYVDVQGVARRVIDHIGYNRANTSSMLHHAAYSLPYMSSHPTSTRALFVPRRRSRVPVTRASCSAMLATRLAS